MRSIVLLVAGAAVALALMPLAGPSGSTGSGLYGTVTKGPVRPVCSRDQPCDAPAQLTLVFSKGGQVVARVRTSGQGKYRLALGPGFYDLQSIRKIGVSRVPKPHAVHVRAGHWDRIDLFFDTGIR